MKKCQPVVPLDREIEPVKVVSQKLFSCAGTLEVTAAVKGIADVAAVAIDRCVPTQLQIFVESDLMWYAYHRKKVTLELLDVTIRTPVMGQDKNSGALLVSAEPLYKEMAKRAKIRNH